MNLIRTVMPGQREFIALMALLMSIVAISIDAMLPALGVMANDLQVSNPNHIQFVIVFIFIGMTLGQLVCGALSDAYGRRPVLFVSVGVYLLGSVICLSAASLPVMLFGRFLQGLGVAGPYVSSVSIIRDQVHGRKMARVMSLVMMIFIMVPAIAPSLGQTVLFLASWHAIFAMYIVYALVIVGWVALRLPETLAPNHRVPVTVANLRHGIAKVFHTRSTLCYTACMGFVFGGLMGYLNSCQQIFQQQYGVGDTFALYFGFLALAFGASSLVNAQLVEKLGMRPLCRNALFTNLALSTAFLIAVMVFPIPLWLFVGYIFLIFFNFGMLFGNLNALAMEPMGSIAGLASAIIGAASSVVSISMGTLIGQSYNGTLVPIIAGLLVFGALSLVFFHLADNPKHKAA